MPQKIELVRTFQNIIGDDMYRLKNDPEMRLVCMSALHPFNSENFPVIRELATASPDWDRILHLARQHRLLEPVLRSLNSAGISALVPAKVMEQLKQDCVSEARQSLANIAMTLRLCREFTAAGIDFLVLKGAPLSSQLYGPRQATIRAPRDVDVLVRPEHYSLAVRALLALGLDRMTYEDVDMTGVDTRLDEELNHGTTYLGQDTKVAVDLHRRIAQNRYQIPMSFAELWVERATVPLGGQLVPVLPDRVNFHYLLLHGTKHSWERLRWLADIAIWARDPERLRQQLASKEWQGQKPIILHGLLLCHRLFNAPLPADVERQVNRPGLHHLLARAALLPKLLPSQAPSLGYYLFSRIVFYTQRQFMGQGMRYRLSELKFGLLKLWVRLFRLGLK